MKKVIPLIVSTITAISFLFLSCTKEDASPCIVKLLSDLDMKLYVGQDLECQWFLQLYTYEGHQYGSLGNHCVDMIAPMVFDCDGLNVCENTSKCSDILGQGTYHGIIGISK